MERTYLDWNATAPPWPQAVEAMRKALSEDWGNASSLHEEGRRAAVHAERAREALAEWTRTRASEWILTSGGTESVHAAILGCAAARAPRRRLVLSAGEHPCALGVAERLGSEGWEIVQVGLRPDGTWDAREVLAACDPDRTALASLIWANNETGAISDVLTVARELAARRIPLHLDAVQCFGRVPVDLSAVPTSFASLSGHKFGAPKGIGALFLRSGAPWVRWMQGGGQERSRRGGTTNAPGAAALSAAVAETRRTDWTEIVSMREELERSLPERVPGLRVLAADAPRLPNTTCLVVPGADSSTLLALLDGEGFAVSSGSACSTGSPEPSHVLLSMGVPVEDAHCALRISLGRSTRRLDLERFAEALARGAGKIRELSTTSPSSL
jgi:cysteine desulfurase